MKARVENMKKDINQMSEEEFKTWLRNTKEGKQLKKEVAERYSKQKNKQQR